MTNPIVLPEKLPSSEVADLVARLGAAKGADVVIDARRVRSIGARAAEILARFKSDIVRAKGTLTIDASSDLEDDLRILGLHGHLIEKELEQ